MKNGIEIGRQGLATAASVGVDLRDGAMAWQREHGRGGGWAGHLLALPEGADDDRCCEPDLRHDALIVAGIGPEEEPKTEHPAEQASEEAAPTHRPHSA